MFKTLTLSAALGLGLVAGSAQAAGDAYVKDFDFSFEGMFGSYDQMQLQRGLQIFTEICSGCHGLEYVTFRALSHPEDGIGWSDDDVRAYIADRGFETYDAEIDDWRASALTDFFPGSALENAPDLSLMAKARAGFHGPYGTGLNQLWYGIGGPEYIASLMTGYTEEIPECAADVDMGGLSYNSAFGAGAFPEECKYENGDHKIPGSWISMSQPLWGEDVDFADGHSNDLASEAEDIAAFLMWAAEPGLTGRKQAGLTGVVFLSVLAVLLYLTNKRLWAPVKKGRVEE